MKFFLAVLTFFFYTITLFGAFDVKIAVYKNAKNLRANIAKIDNAKYKKCIRIENRNHLNYAHAVIASNKEAKDALRVYKSVFNDAFIAKEQVFLPKQKTPTVKVAKTPVVKKLTVPTPAQKIDAQSLLAHKTVYMCYEKGPSHLKNRIVMMVFEEGHVVYNPLIKMVTPIEMPCEFKDDELILHLSDIKMTQQFTKQTPEYLSVKSMAGGTDVEHLRYYFDKQSALAFLEAH